MENAECGAACLAMVLARFGRWESPDAARDLCGVSRDGTSVADVIEAARRFGLDAHAYSREIGGLAALPMPQILYWDFNDFVVLEGIGEDGFAINDSAYGRRVVEPAEFDRRFTGITMTFARGAVFKRKRRSAGLVMRLPGLLWSSYDAFVCVLATSLAIAAIAVLLPSGPDLHAPFPDTRAAAEKHVRLQGAEKGNHAELMAM